MQKIRLIAMGRLTEPALCASAELYRKRLSRFCSLTVAEPKPEPLPAAPSPAEIEKALEKEGARILDEIPPRAAAVALCVEGRSMTSPAFASWLDRAFADGAGEICFLIGSSYGLAPAVKARADLRLSLSAMTFPHELFRVMLLEQLYRAYEINSGGKYHK